MDIGFNLSTVKYNAKDRLLNKVVAYVDEMDESEKVNDQYSAIAGRKTLEELACLNRMTAYKLEKAIMEKEDYDPSKDKWGFGPVKIKPTDYPAFLE